MILPDSEIELVSMKIKSFNGLEQTETNSNCRSFGIKSRPQSNSFHKNNIDIGDDDDDDEETCHEESSTRLVTLEKTFYNSCGFHLSRTKWDPYPWINAVDKFTPADKCNLKVGDCLLEVNGCDVLGLRITEIAKLVKSSEQHVTLLLWSTKCKASCEEQSLCAAPMPMSLQRLSMVVQTVLSLLECPVCLDSITPPAMQCQNGHLLCVNCRIRAEKCPVCRDRYYPRPALIAEQMHTAITNSFHLCQSEVKVRQKVFGQNSCNGKKLQKKTELKQDEFGVSKNGEKSKAKATTNGNRSNPKKIWNYIKKVDTEKNNLKFGTHFIRTKKAQSMENLTNVQMSTAPLGNESFLDSNQNGQHISLHSHNKYLLASCKMNRIAKGETDTTQDTSYLKSNHIGEPTEQHTITKTVSSNANSSRFQRKPRILKSRNGIVNKDECVCVKDME